MHTIKVQRVPPLSGFSWKLPSRGLAAPSFVAVPASNSDLLTCILQLLLCQCSEGWISSAFLVLLLQEQVSIEHPSVQPEHELSLEVIWDGKLHMAVGLFSGMDEGNYLPPV